MSESEDIESLLRRIAAALERRSPPPPEQPDFSQATAFVWQPERRAEGAFGRLRPVSSVKSVPLYLLQGIDQQKDRLLANSVQFARGFPANNALLWGARGMGKSSLVKAVHGELVSQAAALGQEAVRLVELHREDIATLPALLACLRGSAFRFLVFCDDLSFELADSAYKSLKAVLDGGIEGRPDNVLFYATSNRRHLMPRDMMENERATALRPAEVVEEKVSLSDRFGLWIGFHSGAKADYLAMVKGYCAHYGLKITPEHLEAEAVEWAATRGAWSGRVAWQFVCDLAGRLEQTLPLKG